MLKPHLGLEDIEHGLDDEALAPHELVGQRYQMIAHVAPDAGDQVQAALPEFAAQRAADIVLVGVELASQVLGDLVEHSAVGGVAGGDLQRHDLALCASPWRARHRRAAPVARQDPNGQADRAVEWGALSSRQDDLGRRIFKNLDLSSC
jgi:hypothetical protein